MNRPVRDHEILSAVFAKMDVPAMSIAAGVLGALCGVIGSLQALETIKLITGIGEPLRGRLLAYDALAQSFQTLALPRDPHCPLCGPTPSIRDLDPQRYAAITCAPTPIMNDSDYPIEISVTEAKRLLDESPSGVRLRVKLTSPPS